MVRDLKKVREKFAFLYGSHTFKEVGALKNL